MVSQYSQLSKQHRSLTVSTTALLLTLGVAAPVWAAPGDLDTSFNFDGRATLSFSSGPELANAVVIQSDGKIVVGGYGAGHWALTRFNPDGSLDASFGTGGKVTTDVGLCTCGVHALAIQTDGKIVAAGDGRPGTDFDFELARYNIDGSLDTTFGTGGMVATDFGYGEDHARALIIQPDGMIVVAGEVLDGFGHSVGLARYLNDGISDGTLDSTFGTGGLVITPFGGAASYGEALVRQSDGKLWWQAS